MKVIGYIRVSTDIQEASGLGLDAQLAKINGYAGLYDLEIMNIYKDAASGKSLNREGLQDALKDLENGVAEGLVIAKLDRLTRSVKDLGVLLEDYFNKYSLFVVAEQVDTRTASGRLVLNLLTSVAQWERETIGERTKDALKAKKSRGEKTGGHVPYGYVLAADGKTLIEDEKEQEVIKRIVELRKMGMGFRKIAQTINEDGIATKNGKEWKDMTVKRVLERIGHEG